MNVRFVGFDWSLNSVVSLESLMERLNSLRDKKVKLADYDRLIFVAEDSPYWVGLFVTIKDQKRFAEVFQSGGSYKVDILEIEKGSIADLNFFALHSGTKNGLYLHYHQSCGLSSFNYFCKRVHDDIRDERKNEAIQKAQSNRDSSAKIGRIRKHYKGTLKYSAMVRPEDFVTLLDDLKEIKAFESDLFTIHANTNDAAMIPFSGLVKKERHRLTFKKGRGMLELIREAIANSVDVGGITRAKVEGDDDQGARIIKLVNNPSFFAEYDYDTVAENMKIDLDDLASCWPIQELLRIMKLNPLKFETPEA